MLGDEDREGAVLHGFEDRVIGKREQVDYAGNMSSFLPSSNLHSEFEVVSFRGGSRKWVQGVLTWVLGAGGPFWRSFARALFTVFV